MDQRDWVYFVKFNLPNPESPNPIFIP